jgi:hypothetical protein
MRGEYGPGSAAHSKQGIFVLRMFLLDPGSSLQRSCRSSGERGMLCEFQTASFDLASAVALRGLRGFPLEGEGSGAPRGATKHPRRLLKARRAPLEGAHAPRRSAAAISVLGSALLGAGAWVFPSSSPSSRAPCARSLVPRGGVPKPPGSAATFAVPAGAALAPSAERLRKTPLSERGDRSIRPVGTMRITFSPSCNLSRHARA